MNKGTKNIRILKKKGLARKKAILDSAHEIFRQKGYFAASVSEITRHCNIAMGTFYQYFTNKNQVFIELNDLVTNDFMEKSQGLDLEGLGFEERFELVISLLFDHINGNFSFHCILGESELVEQVTIQYYETLANFFRAYFLTEMDKGHIRKMDPDVIAYALVGICYFHSTKWAHPKEKLTNEQMVTQIIDLCVKGVSGKVPWEKPINWDLMELPSGSDTYTADPEQLRRGEKTRNALFEAAGRIFGKYGVNKASISDITREARVAQGTFYIHFKSKRELIQGYVKYVSRELRKQTQTYAMVFSDRRDQERVGMLAFYKFCSEHREIYRIIPEFEMAGNEVGLWYYQRMAQGYARGIAKGIQDGQIREVSPEFLAISLMGLTHFIGLKWIVWSDKEHPIIDRTVFEDIMTLIFHGMAVA